MFIDVIRQCSNKSKEKNDQKLLFNKTWFQLVQFKLEQKNITTHTPVPKDDGKSWFDLSLNNFHFLDCIKRSSFFDDPTFDCHCFQCYINAKVWFTECKYFSFILQKFSNFIFLSIIFMCVVEWFFSSKVLFFASSNIILFRKNALLNDI